MKTFMRASLVAAVLAGGLLACAVHSQTTNPPQVTPLAGGSTPQISLTTTTTNDYTLQVTDYFLVVKKVGLAITLPSSGSGAANGKEYIIKNMVAGTNTIVATSLLDGQSVYLQTNRWWCVRVRSDGTTWNVISKYEP